MIEQPKGELVSPAGANICLAPEFNLRLVFGVCRSSYTV